jgi:hypothetical protein
MGNPVKKSEDGDGVHVPGWLWHIIRGWVVAIPTTLGGALYYYHTQQLDQVRALAEKDTVIAVCELKLEQMDNDLSALVGVK